MARLLATIFIVIIFASMLLEYLCSADRSIMWRRRRRRRAVVAPSGWCGSCKDTLCRLILPGSHDEILNDCDCGSDCFCTYMQTTEQGVEIYRCRPS